MKIMEEYSVAFSEVSEILKIFPEEELNKIPKSYIEIIEKCKDITYEYKLKDGVELHNQEMSEKTRTILSVIYRDYICTEDERKELIKQENKDVVLLETEKRNKYNPNDIFKENNLNSLKQEDSKIETIDFGNELIEIKWYKKIIEKIKKWFYIF